MDKLFNNVKVVIFDLDGTLYEDNLHFKYYANILKENIKEEYREVFSEDYENILKGNHIVSIGKIYDVDNDLVLLVNPDSMIVRQAWKWDGTEVSNVSIKKLYPRPIRCNLTDMISVGDGWWLPDVVAKRYGLIKTYFAYLKTKEYMMSEKFQLKILDGLSSYLKELKKYKTLILLTNSSEEDSHKMLTKLKLGNIFHEIISEAKKPELSIQHFEDILKKYSVEPCQVVSVGDNFVNEVLPALKLGMGTVFIDPYNMIYDYEGIKVKSITEIY